MAKQQNTEDKIVEAAKTVFISKGMDGARMHEIAEEAGINKALLHYYFRTKDKLFEKVFAIVFKDVFLILANAISGEISIEQFIERFITQYMKMLKSKPFLPQFVIHELNRRPERIVNLMKSSSFDKDQLFRLIENAVEKKEIRPIKPVHLLTNILAMCLFPLVASPIIKGFALDGDEKKYKAYMHERPEQVIEFVKHAVIIKRTTQ